MKRPKIIRPTKLNLALPEDIRAKLDLHLYSQVEKRIPMGAYQRFMTERILEFLARQEVLGQMLDNPGEIDTAPSISQDDLHLRLHSGLDIIAAAAERGDPKTFPSIARWARGYQRLLKAKL